MFYLRSKCVAMCHVADSTGSIALEKLKFKGLVHPKMKKMI